MLGSMAMYPQQYSADSLIFSKCSASPAVQDRHAEAAHFESDNLQLS